MKKKLSFILVFCLLITSLVLPASAASVKLSANDNNIIKAYQKCLETNSFSSLNKYKYPGAKFSMPKGFNDLSLKFFNTKYSKSYDSKAKLYKLVITGLLTATDGEKLDAYNANFGLYIKDNKKKSCAYKVADCKYTKTTINDLDEDTVSSIEEYLTDEYDEDTVAALLNKDNEASDEETSDDEDSPETKPGDTKSDDNKSDNATSSKATFTSPVPMGQSFSWDSNNVNFLDNKTSATYKLKINNVKKVSLDDIQKMGFRKPESNSSYEYVLIDLDFSVSNAVFTKVKGENEEYVNVAWGFDPWGIKSSEKDSIVGVTDYGFDESISKAIDNATNLKKVKAGEKTSYSASGKVLAMVFKGKTNYLVMRNYAIDDYDSAFMYFKLN